MDANQGWGNVVLQHRASKPLISFASSKMAILTDIWPFLALKHKNSSHFHNVTWGMAEDRETVSRELEAQMLRCKMHRCIKNGPFRAI